MLAKLHNDDFDYVIVGAGSAGSVLAARLSADARVRVLLLEAGTARQPLFARIPAAFSKLFKSRHDWAYETEPEAELEQRRLFIPRGKLLGGSSAINAMIYIRGNPADFDGWARLGALGWAYSDVLPWFVASEDQARGALPAHGVGGPLRVEDPRSVNPLSLAFVEACVELGIPANHDFNSGSQLGAGLYQLTQKSGVRWSRATARLAPVCAPASRTAELEHRGSGGFRDLTRRRCATRYSIPFLTGYFLESWLRAAKLSRVQHRANARGAAQSRGAAAALG